MKPLTDLRLGEIDLRLSAKDREILQTLRILRFVRTNQIQRLYFEKPTSTPRARLTATTKTLHRLQEAGLVDHLDRRIGGNRAGTQGLVWHLTEAGGRLLDLGKEQDKKRKRPFEPSLMFLRHTLAVGETYVQITDICTHVPEMSLRRLKVEPECWRSYQKSGKEISLRPDLYAEVISGGYVHYWFIEMDLGTEGMQAIIEKCRRYHEYRAVFRADPDAGTFPLILWIVPTPDRKEKMRTAMVDTFGGRYARIFMVITPEELYLTLRDGAEQEALC